MAGESQSTCALVGDFSLGTSYGSIPCNLCTSSEPICLVTDSGSSGAASGAVGVCTCMQQPTPMQGTYAIMMDWMFSSILPTFAYCLIMLLEQGVRAWTFGSAWCLMRRSCVRCRCTPERRRERSARSTTGTTLRRRRASSSAWATRTVMRSAGALFRLFLCMYCMH